MSKDVDTYEKSYCPVSGPLNGHFLAACSGGSQGTSGNTTPPTNSGAPSNDTISPSDGPTYHWQVGNVLAADQPWDLGLVKFAELLNEYSGGRMERPFKAAAF